MKSLILIGSLLLASSVYGQVKTLDRSDTTIHTVFDYWYYDHWRLYPFTSAVYIPPCIYRIISPDTSTTEIIAYTGTNNQEQYQLVEQHDKYGIVNEGDTIIVPIQYDSLIRITNTTPKVFIAKINNKFGLLNAQNDVVIPFEYDRIHLMTNGQYYGFMNSTLQVEKDGKQGLMRVDGSVELTCNYDYIDNNCGQTDCPKDGIQYYVGIDGKYGYINRDESLAINPNYEALEAKGFSGLIRAKNDGKVGLMDTLENFILPQDYEQLFDENMSRFPNLTAFKKSGKWGLMYGEYSDMKIILENRFDSVMTDYSFDDHFIIINDGKWGLADTTGKVVIQPQFEQIEAMEDGTFAYKKDGRWGFMDETGFIHCSPRYDAIYENEKNWCLVMKGSGYGFCKTSGEQIVAPIYDIPIWDDYVHWGELIYSGRIAMSKSDHNGDCKMGVIDSNGRVLLPFEYDCYDEVVYNYGSCLIASKNGKDVMINSDGKEVYLGDYDEIERRRYGYEYFFPMKGEKVGLVSPDCKLLSKPKYDRIEHLIAGGGEGQESTMYFLVEQHSKVGLLDSNGLTVLSPIYESLAMIDEHYVELVSESKVKLYNLKTKKYESFSAVNIYQFNGVIGAFTGSGEIAFFIDSLGNRINEDNYNNIWLFGPDLNYFRVEKAGRYGICDSSGKLLIEPKFSKIKFWDGEFGAGKSGVTYCFFDAKGDTIVGYRYQKVKGVYEDYVCVRIKNKFGVVNKIGETVIEPTLQIKLDFGLLKEFGLTTVWENYKIGVINSEMKTVLPSKYDLVKMLRVHDEVYVITSNNEGLELFDARGNSLSIHIFNEWEQDDAGELFLFNDLGWFKLDKSGDIMKTER